jgi:3-methyladenine DNA glycosylase AlkD
MGHFWFHLVETFETLVGESNLRKNDAKQIVELEVEILARVSALDDPNIAEIRRVRREFSQRLRDASWDIVIGLALRLVRRKQFLLRFVAYELVQHHKSSFDNLNAGLLEELGRGIDSWAAVDTFACYLSGPAWREQQVSDALIMRWVRSRNRWWRRAAVVSTVPLNLKARGGLGDSSRTLEICAMVVKDRDDMVVKALSWALRELTKRDPELVRDFLAEHRRELAPRVLREVNNKIEHGLKSGRRGGS